VLAEGLGQPTREPAGCACPESPAAGVVHPEEDAGDIALDEQLNQAHVTLGSVF
jgi:hypothetical protein